MPKQGTTIKRFDGGLNTKDSQRDIPDGFLQSATNIDVSSIGKVKLPGQFAAFSSDIVTSSSPDIIAGFGLFSFKTDERIDGSNAAGEYFAMTNDEGVVTLGSTSVTGINLSADSLDMSGHGSGVKPVYYYANGGLRVADTVLSHQSSNAGSYVYLNRDSSDAPYGSAVDGYFATEKILDKPNVNSADEVEYNITGLDDADDGASDLGDPGSKKITVGVKANTIDGTNNVGDGLWAEGKYLVAVSYVYYDNQESLLTNIGSFNLSDGQSVLAQVAIGDGEFGSGDYKFIEGIRVYLKNYNDADSEHLLLLDVDFARGSRINFGDDFDAFIDKTTHVVTDDAQGAQTGTDASAYQIMNASFVSFSDSTGFEEEEEEITFQDAAYGYKTATVFNQRAFVGNVRYKDTDGNVKIMGDRIQYTPVRKYDTFPQSYYLEIGANDGDEIIKIIEFNDKLFVYKTKKLFVIDASSPNPGQYTLIGEFENRGIGNPNAVVKSDLGLVWANKDGLFGYFDGIATLSKAIDDDDWSSSINLAGVALGYIPKKNQIFINNNTSESSNPDGYIYDLNTSSFINIDDSHIMVSQATSNLIQFDDSLCVMRHNTGQLLKFDTGVAVQAIDMSTKEFDFDSPTQDKKIYSIYVTYKYGGGISLRYGLNGEAATRTTIDRQGTSSNALDTSSSFVTEKFTFESSTTAKSIQLNFTGTAANANFEIEDITIVYRTKPLK
jgi:hypothetical protein|tara:strand:+ start:158 stop:2323 length:2166 start_codon:yes stop_codon:yes gene_type:complete